MQTTVLNNIQACRQTNWQKVRQTDLVDDISMKRYQKGCEKDLKRYEKVPKRMREERREQRSKIH